MCVMDYDFHVLNNAFLIHRPGIKYFVNPEKHQVWEQDVMIRDRILPQLQKLFGIASGCTK